jgi:hypothetical protein
VMSVEEDARRDDQTPKTNNSQTHSTVHKLRLHCRIIQVSSKRSCEWEILTPRKVSDDSITYTCPPQSE